MALAEQTLPVRSGAETARKLAEGVASLGIGRLPWTKPLEQWRARVQFLRRADPGFPDLSDEALAASAADWLAPFIEGRTSLASVTADDLGRALGALLPWDLARRLDAEARRISMRRPATGTPSTMRRRAGLRWPSACRSFSG